jgi:hypothetical protein
MSNRKLDTCDVRAIDARPNLSPQEVALLAGITLSTLYRRWEQGTGPASYFARGSRSGRVLRPSRRHRKDGWKYLFV